MEDEIKYTGEVSTDLFSHLDDNFNETGNYTLDQDRMVTLLLRQVANYLLGNYKVEDKKNCITQYQRFIEYLDENPNSNVIAAYDLPEIRYKEKENVPNSYSNLKMPHNFDSIYFCFSIWRFNRTKDTFHDFMQECKTTLESLLNTDSINFSINSINEMTIVTVIDVFNNALVEYSRKYLDAVHELKIISEEEKIEIINRGNNPNADFYFPLNTDKEEIAYNFREAWDGYTAEDIIEEIYGEINAHDTPRLYYRKQVCIAFKNMLGAIDILSIICEALSLYKPDSNELKDLSPSEIECFLLNKELFDDQVGKIVSNLYSYKFIYSEYFADKRINVIQNGEKTIQEFENNVNIEIGALLEYFDTIIDSNDIEDVIAKKTRIVSQLKLTGASITSIEKVITKIIARVQSDIKEVDKFQTYFDALQKEMYKYSPKINVSIIEALATAEILYDDYIINSKPLEKFDYSCISIMYYQVLEFTLNEIIYEPYKKEYEAEFLSRLALNQDFTPIIPFGWKNFYDNNRKLKNKLELGVMAHFLIGAADSRTSYKFRLWFLGLFNKSANVDSIKEIGRTIKTISKARNDAAHGGTSIDIKSAIEAKNYVYNKSISMEMRSILTKLLEMTSRVITYD